MPFTLCLYRGWDAWRRVLRSQLAMLATTSTGFVPVMRNVRAGSVAACDLV